MDRKKILIIGSVLLIVLLAYGIYSQVTKPSANTNKITSYTDSVTGETIVDAKNKSPEKNDGLGGPTMLGLTNIQPLFGDDLAFQLFRDTLLREEYKSNSVLKISKDNIKRAVHTNDGITTIDISFDYYLDNKDTVKYSSVVSYNQSSGLITERFTSPTGQVTSRETHAFGDD